MHGSAGSCAVAWCMMAAAQPLLLTFSLPSFSHLLPADKKRLVSSYSNFARRWGIVARGGVAGRAAGAHARCACTGVAPATLLLMQLLPFAVSQLHIGSFKTAGITCQGGVAAEAAGAARSAAGSAPQPPSAHPCLPAPFSSSSCSTSVSNGSCALPNNWFGCDVTVVAPDSIIKQDIKLECEVRARAAVPAAASVLAPLLAALSGIVKPLLNVW